MDANENRRTKQDVPASCENWNGFVVNKDASTNTVIIARTRCKQWSCGYCAEMNRIAWRYRIADTTSDEQHGEWSFCTFTAKGTRRGSAKSLKDFRDAMPKIIRRMRGMEGAPLCYIRVYERHSDGTYHIHMLVNRRFDVKHIVSADGKNDYYRNDEWADWLASKSVGLGWKHDLRPLKKLGNFGIGRYVTKYMLKEDADEPFPPKLRRFQASQNFAKQRKDTSAGEWEFHSSLHSRDFVQWWSEGFEVIDNNKRITIESADLPATKTGNMPSVYSDLDDRYD